MHASTWFSGLIILHIDWIYHLYICMFWWSHRLLPRDRSVLRRDVLLLLPEEQLQELPDVLHAGPVLPQLLLQSARCMNWWSPASGRRPALLSPVDVHRNTDVMMLSYSLSWKHCAQLLTCSIGVLSLKRCRCRFSIMNTVLLYIKFFRFSTATTLFGSLSNANPSPQNKSSV